MPRGYENPDLGGPPLFQWTGVDNPYPPPPLSTETSLFYFTLTQKSFVFFTIIYCDAAKNHYLLFHYVPISW